MRAWIFAAYNTSADDALFYKRLKFGEDDIIICADGGYDTAALLSIKPDVVIGDMDSVKRPIPSSVKRIVYPEKKDKTDLDLCIDYALERGFREIILLCAFGGRIDHSLAALISLRRIMEEGADGLLLTKHSKVFLIKGRTVIRRGDYNKISLIPVGVRASGVTTTGLSYPLTGAELVQTDNLGISNSFRGNEASVDVTDGVLCVVCEV